MSFIIKSFAEDNFFEFLVHKKPAKAIILLPGFPSNNNQDEIMHYFFDQGYNVFFMRYKGMFQSEGEFLSKDPSDDVVDFVNFLKKGRVINLWNDTRVSFTNTKYIVVTGSFSGAIALSTISKIKNIKKIILFSPVWDYSLHNETYKEQELAHLTKFVKKAWNNLYNFTFDNIQEQMNLFEDCLWENYHSKLDDKKILVFQDPKDQTTSINHTEYFKKQKQVITLQKHNKGHGMNIDILTKYAKNIIEFIECD